MSAWVEAKVVRLRFPISGQVVYVNFSLGDKVNKGQVLASLDNTILKKRQERELKDYDKIRSQFEEIKSKGNNVLLARAQADLEAAVLAVEILDWESKHASIVAPEDGVIIDDGGLAVGIYASPASFEVKLQVLGSEFIRAEVDQEVAYQFKKDDRAEFELERVKTKSNGRVLRILPAAKPGQFYVDAVVENPGELRAGSVGKLNLRPAEK